MLTKNTSLLRERVTHHFTANTVVQEDGWNPRTQSGGILSCLAGDDDPVDLNEEQFGIPVMLQRIAAGIFNDLPAEASRVFFAALPGAIERDGKDLSKVCWQFLAAELRAMHQPPDIQRVIDPVIDGMDALGSGREWPLATAYAATAYAANAAAYAATAYAAANAAANAAAYAAARLRQRDLLLRLIKEAPCQLQG